MKKYASVLLGLALALLIPATAACDMLGGNNPSDVVKNVIALVDTTQTSIVLPAEGGKVYVSFNTSASWEASSNASWLTVSPESGSASGSITVAAEANNTGADRSAKVFISLNDTDVSLTIKATQGPINSDNPGPDNPKDPKGLELEATVGGWNAGASADFTYEAGGSGWTEYAKVSVAQPWWIGEDNNGNAYCESSVLLTKELDKNNVLCCIPGIFDDGNTEPSDLIFVWNTSTNWLDVDLCPIGYIYQPQDYGQAGQVFVSDYYHYYSLLQYYAGAWKNADEFYTKNASNVLRSRFVDNSSSPAGGSKFQICGTFFIPEFGSFSCPYDDYIITATITK